MSETPAWVAPLGIHGFGNLEEGRDRIGFTGMLHQTIKGTTHSE